MRDAAVILLGYASAMRRSELTALTLLDVEEKTDGLLVTIRQSKTDQEGQGQIVAVARGENPETDPVAALAAWRRLRGHEPGPLFPRVLPQPDQPSTALRGRNRPDAPRPRTRRWS